PTFTFFSEEEETLSKKAEIGFDYGTGETKTNGELGEGAGSEDSDSETEPFEPPPGIKLPVGLAVFGFLEFDNPLHPYYKYLSKLIREKKYTPTLTKRAKRSPRDKAGSASPKGTTGDNKEKKSNALTALASQHENDSDSDSDCELHPSLLSGARKGARSPDVIDGAENAAGPRRRPASPSPPRVTAHRHDYDMSTSNDIYASLFKSLSQVSVEREEAERRKKEKIELAKHIAASAPPPPDEEYQAWWLSFYGTPCPFSSPQPMVPPPPDLQPVIASYADFVARHGAEAELELRDRADLQLTFMHPHSPHFSYYQHRVRLVQWELAKKAAEHVEEAAQTVPKVSSSPALLHSTSVVQPVVEEGAVSDGGTSGVLVVPPPRPFPSVPVSFTLAPIKEEIPCSSTGIAVTEDPASAVLVDARTLSPLTIAQPPVPSPHARIFMERLLNEKRVKKLREQEEARIRELEAQKAEIERQLAEEDAKKKKTSLEMVDKLIN
ncbi:surp module, partial [Teladorsagia circumcincta]